MGRVVLEAALYPFRRVIGVDVVPQFVAVARETVDRNRHRLRCGEVELLTADALSYQIPDDLTVLYMFNPFGGDLFDAVMSQLAASVDRRPRRVRIIYLAAPEEAELDRFERARFVRYGRRRVRRWAAAENLKLYEFLPRATARAKSR
jgi:hypothetical protein